jgi:uncharacterized membrane protein YhaH (DUF805 family)
MNLFRYWSPSGRFTRLQWWRFQIWAMFGFIVVLFASISIANDTLRVGFVAVAALFLTWIIVGLKRLHDRNKSAWWLALFCAAPFLCIPAPMRSDRTMPFTSQLRPASSICGL